LYDQETFDFIKKGMRGGVSMIPLRYAKANNPEMGEKYDPSNPISYLLYLDCNSLYSSIMSKKLPYQDLIFVKKDLKWLMHKLDTYQPTDEVGYFIECDIRYPPRIHDKTADLPLAPEHQIVTQSMLSDYSEKIRKKFNINLDRQAKLLSTQYDRTKYVCHIENLQFYMKEGMQITDLYRVLEFKQDYIFKPYIEFCINNRSASTEPDVKTMWKLACNSIFGKTITNLEKQNNAKILTDEKKTLRAIASPRFKHADVIQSDVIQVTSFKKRILINTPYYIGVTILELSKLYLMQTHYNYFLPRFGRFKLKLCMTDTDSLLYHIQTENLYTKLSSIPILDFSNYPPEHPLHNTENKGKLFFLKDEVGGRIITGFVGLRAKSYSIKFLDEKQKVIGKGIPKENTQLDVSSQHLRSFKHQMFTIEQTKIALSPYDNKRFILPDGITTLPFGHVDTL
jgi:uncharacterized protein YeeX (DUF496 family)